jgi:hypothetical protein
VLVRVVKNCALVYGVDKEGNQLTFTPQSAPFEMEDPTALKYVDLKTVEAVGVEAPVVPGKPVARKSATKVTDQDVEKFLSPSGDQGGPPVEVLGQQKRR